MRRKRMRRVLMAIPNFNGGGAERVALHLARSIDRDKFTVRVFAHERTGSLLSEVNGTTDIVVHNERSYRRTQLPGLLAATLRLARDADVLIGANEGRASFLMVVAAEILKKPVVCWLHNDWREFSNVVSWRQRLSLRTYARADAVVACSQGVADSFLSLVPFRKGSLRVIYNGIPLNRIRSLSEEQIPPQCERTFQGATVLTAGRLVYQKGHEFLIAAHALLIRRGLAHQLVILGEGPLERELKAYALSLGVASSVHFLGFQANPYRFMRRATVFALSSRFEGFGVVLAEALCCRASIVAVDCPSGPREVLEDGKYGILVGSQDPEALADGLARAMNDETARLELAERASARAECFDSRHTVAEWERVLDMVTESAET
jgi:glycosyltransferase involved in cell wall biosynthesis